jgi:hypothetical protein
MTRLKNGSTRVIDAHRGWRITALFRELQPREWETYIEMAKIPAGELKEKPVCLTISTEIQGTIARAWKVAQGMAQETIDYRLDREEGEA